MLHQVLKDITEICSDAPPLIVKKMEDYVNGKKQKNEWKTWQLNTKEIS